MKSLRREIELYIERELRGILEANTVTGFNDINISCVEVINDLEHILDETAKAIENGDN